MKRRGQVSGFRLQAAAFALQAAGPKPRRRAAERGQSLVFAALTLFGLAVMALMIVGIGDTSSTQMRLQNAADAAALSGAQVEADIVAQTAWLNEGMSDIYYVISRHAVDNATYATLAELEDVHEEFGGGANKLDALGFTEDMDARWRDAYDRARVEIPSGEAWLRRLSALQRAMVALGPDLVDSQIRFTATVDGSTSAACYPGFRYSYGWQGRRDQGLIFLPDNPDKRIVEITKIGDGASTPWQPNGWELIGIEPADFEMHAEHTAHDEDYNGGAGQFDHWNVTLNQSGRQYEVRLDAMVDDSSDGRPALYDFKVSVDGTPDDRVVKVLEDGRIIVIGSGPDVEVTVNDDGSIEVKQGANSTTMRDGPNGEMEYWDDEDKDGEKDADEWKPVTGGSSVTANGVQVPISTSRTIQIQPGLSVDLHDPITIHMGPLHVTLDTPLRINYGSPAGWVNMRDDNCTLHGLSTKRHADGLWRPINDLTRHRILELEPDLRFRYERRSTGSLMTEMDMVKLACHGIMQNDPDYYDASPPVFWRMPDAVEPDSALWLSDGEGQWQYYPLWARPKRPLTDFASTNWGGFFDIRSGRSYSRDDDNHLNQTRTCWYCAGDPPVDVRGTGGTAVPGTNGLPDLVRSRAGVANPRYWGTTGRACVRPAGFWHMLYETEDAMDAAMDALQDAGYDDLYYAAPEDFPPGDRYPYGSRYVIQVTCPCCMGRWDFRQDAHPKAFDGVSPEQIESGSPDVCGIKARVRRSLHDAYERRNPGRDAYPPHQELVEDRGHQPGNPGTNGARDFYSLDLAGFKPALELTEDFFRNSITVMTWKPAVEDRVWRNFGGSKPDEVNIDREAGDWRDGQSTAGWAGRNDRERQGHVNPYSKNDFGHFAIATARLHFPKQDEDGSVQILHRFGWEGLPLAHVTTDPLDPPTKWDRLRWLRGSYNLFEPDWTAALVQVKQAVEVRDMYPVGETGGDEDTALLFRLLRRTGWRKSVTEGYGNHNRDPRPHDEMQRMSPPPMQQGGTRIDWDSSTEMNALQEAMQH